LTMRHFETYNDSVKESIMPEEWLTIDQVEKEFGLKRSTLYRHVAQGEISTQRRVGDRRAYVKREDVVKLLEFKPSERRSKTKYE
jgi:predicted DNA-binding transcriptional regulator AlpA